MDFTLDLPNILKQTHNILNTSWDENQIPSLTKTISPLLVDPKVIVPFSLRNDENVTKVITLLSTTFITYYTQVFKMVGQIDDMRVIQAIRDLSSIDRGRTGNIGGVVLESFDDSGLTLTMEEVNADLPKDFSKLQNLSTGYVVNLSISGSNDRKITLPVLIRMNVHGANNNLISHILGIGDMENSLRSRLDALGAGEISFWKDFVFAQDIIKEHKKLLMKDESGLYQDVSGRVSGAYKRWMRDRTKGYGAFYNMVIIDSHTQNKIEAELGGSLNKKRYRDKLFNRNHVMLMAVMDLDFERVSLYTRDVDAVTNFGFNELKANVSGGDSLMSLMKSMNNPLISI